MSRAPASLILGLVMFLPEVDQPAKLFPVNEAHKDPSLQALVARVLEATEKKDVAYVLSILDPHIKNSFGGSEGIEEFKEMWELDRPESSKLWPTLRTVLALGGTFDGKNSFTAPYVFSRWPDRFDAFEYRAIIKEGVEVRASPDESAPSIATLSYDIVEVADWNPAGASEAHAGWIKVKLPGNRTGFVPAEAIRSPIDYRARFEKRGQRWVMTLLIAGD